MEHGRYTVELGDTFINVNWELGTNKPVTYSHIMGIVNWNVAKMGWNVV